ncbi:DUF302 domain-containing protein [Trinickia mobilis]|uniref:DUF302 domain-containing protein n=1 Tax=Trinickia mobilis TaxID=2816356 RepID=UPI001A909C2E|nr:DUF302 domain-containing protein [Trinickia mobilis]
MTTPTDTAGDPLTAITLQSRHDFQTTVFRLTEALAASGIRLFADIDQAAAARDAGMALRPTRLFIFGNPKAGTPVMAANPLAALELPFRAVIWEDDAHAVYVTYDDVKRKLGGVYRVDPSLCAPYSRMPELLRRVVEED